MSFTDSFLRSSHSIRLQLQRHRDVIFSIPIKPQDQLHMLQALRLASFDRVARAGKVLGLSVIPCPATFWPEKQLRPPVSEQMLHSLIDPHIPPWQRPSRCQVSTINTQLSTIRKIPCLPTNLVY
jgi:hypothetical protein